MPQVTGPLSTTAPTDVFATHDSQLGVGGLREVATHSARNAITTERRRRGMMVFTQDDSTYWTLKAGPWAGTDADWEPSFDAGDLGVLAVTSGGTGATTVRAARVNLGALSGLMVLIPSDGVETSFDLVHGRNFAWTQPPSVIEIETGQEIIPDVYVLDSSTVRVSFGDPPPSNAFNCVILGMEA